MINERRKWGDGLFHFCRAKQLNIQNTVDLFLTEKNLPLRDKATTIQSNWRSFASWVNEKMVKGELKGRKVSVSNGSEEEKQERRIRFASQPEGLRKWYTTLNNTNGNFNTSREQLLNKFFHSIGLTKPNKLDRTMQIENYEPHYNTIVESGNLEIFYEYCKDWK